MQSSPIFAARRIPSIADEPLLASNDKKTCHLIIIERQLKATLSADAFARLLGLRFAGSDDFTIMENTSNLEQPEDPRTRGIWDYNSIVD